MSAFPSIKLTYFAAAGRAETVRLAFYIGGVPFVDERVGHEQFAALKSELPLGQLPVLEVDGQLLTQSHAMLRFAGRLGGLYPVSSPFAALKIDEILHVMGELEEQMAPSFQVKDADKKKAMREELASITIPRYAALIEARLQALLKHKIFQSEQVFIHQVALYGWVKSLRAGYMDHIPSSVLDGFTLINAAYETVAEHPKVTEWYSLPHGTPSLKLTYFPVPGRAEPIRLALFMAGIPFEDVHVTHEQLLALKPSLPFQCVPVLEVNGEVISQALAILRYVGSLSGLYPTANPIDAIRVDEVFALIDELYNAPTFSASLHASDPAKKEELGAAAASSEIPKSLGFLDKRVSDFNAEHATGATLNVADLAIYVLVSNLSTGRLKGVPPTIAEPFKSLQRVRENVHAHPKVAKWNATKK
jgi:glutathione S-transferase